MRRLSALALAIALLAALVPLAGPAVAVGTFDDDDGNIHEANIEKIATLGITKGCNPPTNNLYCPDDYVTRQQMASFLVRAFDLPPTSSGQFTDIAGSVHAADINALAASGITKGCNPPANTQYCPTAQVTRGQMAAFMARGLELSNVTENFFDDDNGSIFETQINAIARIGITKGCNPPANRNYCPDNPVRRDEMASFLSRVANILTTGTTVTTTPAPTTTLPGVTTTTTLPLPPGEKRGLFTAANSDRQPAVVLQGAAKSGNAYMFAGPDQGVTQTRFYIDDPSRTGSPYRVEDISKFDLEGTAPDGNAFPFDTFQLKNGSHNLTAEMVLTGGTVEVYSDAFTVSNPASVWLNKPSESFNLPPGGSSGTPKSVQVDSNNGAAINWSATDNAPWLTFTKSSGTKGQSVSFDASATSGTGNLTPGVRTATVTVTAPGFQSRTFTVTMNVLAVGSCPSPNGANVLVGLPFSTSFTSAAAGTVATGNGAGTGFTCVQATSNGQGYLAGNLSLDTSAGNLAITTTAGIADQTTDTQDNALGVGFDGSGVTRLETTLVSPPWQGNGGFEQAGLWAGIHEDTYVKAVLLDNNTGGMAVQLRSERAPGTIDDTVTTPLGIASSPGTLRLVLTINQGANQASLSYSVNGGALVGAGTVPVSASIFNGVDPDGGGANGPTPGGTTLGGIFASHRTGTPSVYTFGDFLVTK